MCSRCAKQLVEQRLESRAILRRGERLVWVGAAIGLHGSGFATPDELRAAKAEVPPTAKRVLRRRAIAVGVPTFHGMDAPAIADLETTDDDRLGQWRTFGGRQNAIVDRQLEAEFRQSASQGSEVFQLRDLGVTHRGKRRKGRVTSRDAADFGLTRMYAAQPPR